jgi:hypothetical protein
VSDRHLLARKYLANPSTHPAPLPFAPSKDPLDLASRQVFHHACANISLAALIEGARLLNSPSCFAALGAIGAATGNRHRRSDLRTCGKVSMVALVVSLHG